jgi:hypothetical protein
MVREEYLERAAPVEPIQFGHDLREGYVVAVVSIDPVQACRSARLVVRLRIDDET